MADFLFRADANPRIGTGHVMRCLAIAEALHDRGAGCHFAFTEALPATERRLAAEGVGLHRVPGDAAATGALATRLGAAAIVLDGYHFDGAWRQALKAGGKPVLTFQDHGESELHADLVVNAAAEPSGPGPENTIRLAGPAYALLRRELVRAMALPSLELAARDSILVTFGGSDPAGLTLPVTAALRARLATVPLDVVVGGGVPDGAGIVARLAELGAGIRIHRDPLEMGGMMRAAGLAVSAAGGTIGELAALAVPAIIAAVAANQELGSRRAAADGWCQVIDARENGAVDRLAAAAAALWADEALRGAMSEHAHGLIDGKGAGRVAQALLDLSA